MSARKEPVVTKPPLALVPKAELVYSARGHQYGASKYRHGDFYTAVGVSLEERLMEHLSGVLRHLTTVTDSVGRAIGSGGNLTLAACVQDDESGLPHLAHALARLGVAIAWAVEVDILPEDPGAPWLEGQPEIADRAVPPECYFVDTSYGAVCGRHDMSLEEMSPGTFRCRLTKSFVSRVGT